MMKQLKRWLIMRYFPAAAKEEIARLKRELIEKDAEIASLHSYIDGLEFGMRMQRRMVVHNEVKK